MTEINKIDKFLLNFKNGKTYKSALNGYFKLIGGMAHNIVYLEKLRTAVDSFLEF